MPVECAGLQGALAIGARCKVVARVRRCLPCEVVGFRSGQALLMPFGPLDGVGRDCRFIQSTRFGRSPSSSANAATIVLIPS